MTNGYEEARGQRNWLERLGDKIPGYRGFQDRELRRDVDRQLREHLAAELGRLKGLSRDHARGLGGRRQARRPSTASTGSTASSTACRRRSGSATTARAGCSIR